MALSLTQSAVDLISSAGYLGLALGLIVDSAGIPIPSEVLVPLATVSAKQGNLNLVAVILVSIVAQVIGGIIAYEIGRRGGVPFIKRYGKYVLLSQRDLDITRAQFERRGQLLAFMGRCIPVVRGYIGFVAGIAEMPFKRFLMATIAGSMLWTLILAAAGWLLAEDITVIDRVLKPFSELIIIAIVVAVICFIVVRIRQNRKQVN